MTRLPKPINQPVVVKVVRVSGTIRKAEDEVIRRAQEIINRAKNVGVESNRGIGGPVADIVKAADRRRDVEVLAGEDEEEESGSDE